MIFLFLVALLLEHSSATEKRLCEGTGVHPEEDEEPLEEDGTRRILQETTLALKFRDSAPTLYIREIVRNLTVYLFIFLAIFIFIIRHWISMSKLLGK